MIDINVSRSHTWSSQTKGRCLNNTFDLEDPFSTNLSQGTNTSERDNIAWAFQHFLTKVWYFQTETSSCINEMDDLLQQQINITNMSRFPSWTNELHSQTRSINLIEIFTDYLIDWKPHHIQEQESQLMQIFFLQDYISWYCFTGETVSFFNINNAWSKIPWEVKVQIKTQMTRKIHACFDGCSHMNGNHGQEPSRCNEKCGVMSAPCSFWGRPFLGNTGRLGASSKFAKSQWHQSHMYVYAFERFVQIMGAVCIYQYVYIIYILIYTYIYIYISICITSSILCCSGFHLLLISVC